MRFRPVFAALLLMLGLVLPAAAQEQNTLTITYEQFSLTVAKDFLTGLTVAELPADPPENGPGFAEPASVQIAFSNPAPGFAPESILTLRFYRTADFAAYPEHQRRLEQLQTLLADRPDLAAYATYREDAMADALPFLPVYPHGQVLSARTAYVETPMLNGIAYVAGFAADVAPFNSNSFVYTVQAVTPDGAYYVSAQAFVTTDLFPAELPAFDPAAFQANLPTYIAESIATLQAGAAEDFSPSTAAVDAIIQSITITPPPMA